MRLRELFCIHQNRFVGYRDARHSNRDFIYECHKCGRIKLTHIRDKKALNDHVIDMLK